MRTNRRVVVSTGIDGTKLTDTACSCDNNMESVFYGEVSRLREEGFPMRVSPNGVFAMGQRANEFRVVDCYWDKA